MTGKTPAPGLVRAAGILAIGILLATRPAMGQAPAPSEPAAAPAPMATAAPAPASPPAAPALPPALSGEATLLPEAISPWSMVRDADIVVQGVMAGLALASLVTWTIWLAKALGLMAAKRKARSATRRLAESDTLDQAVRTVGSGWTRSGPVADMIQAATLELRRSATLPAEGIKERLSIQLPRIEARAGRSMASGTGVLATIGSTAPFVGLFGTVWGIMNAFIGISQTRTTSLAVVAPGIAEALLATAIGLVAAIPAVIIYNVFARSIAGYRALLADASAEVLQHVSRDLDRSRLAPPAEAPLSRRPAQLAAAE